MMMKDLVLPTLIIKTVWRRSRINKQTSGRVTHLKIKQIAKITSFIQPSIEVWTLLIIP